MAAVDGSATLIEIPKLPTPVKDFIPYLAKNPTAPITTLLEPYKAYESELRKVYAQQPDHEAIRDGSVNLIPLFEGHETELKIRARSMNTETDDEKSRYLMALNKEDRKPNGAPAVVTSFKDFQQNFNLFSESSLTDLDWNNGLLSEFTSRNVPEKSALTCIPKSCGRWKLRHYCSLACS